MTFKEYRNSVKETVVGFWKDMFYQAGDTAKSLRLVVKFVNAFVVAALLMVAYLTVIAMPIIILAAVFDMGKFLSLLIGVPGMIGLIILTAPFIEPVLDWYWEHILTNKEEK